MDERTEPMTPEEFWDWAAVIKLAPGQKDPIWYVIGREYDRGRAAERKAALDSVTRESHGGS